MFKRPWLVACLFVLVAAATAAPARAQFPLGGRGLPGSEGLIMLATTEPMRRELELDPDQRDRIRKLAEEIMGQGRKSWQTGGINVKALRELGTLAPRERARRMQELSEIMVQANRKAHDAAVPRLAEILTEKQLTRLKQIQWQAAGSQAMLEDPELSAALALTDEQREQIVGIQRKYAKQQANLGRNLFGRKSSRNQETDVSPAEQADGDPPSDADKPDEPDADSDARDESNPPQARSPSEMIKLLHARTLELLRERNDLAAAVLTAEQQATLTRMLGPPFDLARLQQSPTTVGRESGRTERPLRPIPDMKKRAE